MDKKGDSILYLMQDIKTLLFGAGLILAGIALTLFGGAAVYLSGYFGGLWEFAAVLLWLAAAVLLLCGIVYVWLGWTAHKLTENDQPD